MVLTLELKLMRVSGVLLLVQGNQDIEIEHAPCLGDGVRRALLQVPQWFPLRPARVVEVEVEVEVEVGGYLLQEPRHSVEEVTVVRGTVTEEERFLWGMRVSLR